MCFPDIYVDTIVRNPSDLPPARRNIQTQSSRHAELISQVPSTARLAAKITSAPAITLQNRDGSPIVVIHPTSPQGLYRYPNAKLSLNRISSASKGVPAAVAQPILHAKECGCKECVENTVQKWEEKSVKVASVFNAPVKSRAPSVRNSVKPVSVKAKSVKSAGSWADGKDDNANDWGNNDKKDDGNAGDWGNNGKKDDGDVWGAGGGAGGGDAWGDGRNDKKDDTGGGWGGAAEEKKDGGDGWGDSGGDKKDDVWGNEPKKGDAGEGWGGGASQIGHGNEWATGTKKQTKKKKAAKKQLQNLQVNGDNANASNKGDSYTKRDSSTNKKGNVVEKPGKDGKVAPAQRALADNGQFEACSCNASEVRHFHTPKPTRAASEGVGTQIHHCIPTIEGLPEITVTCSNCSCQSQCSECSICAAKNLGIPPNFVQDVNGKWYQGISTKLRNKSANDVIRGSDGRLYGACTNEIVKLARVQQQNDRPCTGKSSLLRKASLSSFRNRANSVFTGALASRPRTPTNTFRKGDDDDLVEVTYDDNSHRHVWHELPQPTTCIYHSAGGCDPKICPKVHRYGTYETDINGKTVGNSQPLFPPHRANTTATKKAYRFGDVGPKYGVARSEASRYVGTVLAGGDDPTNLRQIFAAEARKRYGDGRVPSNAVASTMNGSIGGVECFMRR